MFWRFEGFAKGGKEVDEKSLGRLNVVSLVLVVVQYWISVSLEYHQ